MTARQIIVAAGLSAGLAAFGQGRDDFMRQQAFAEMQRVSGQVDVLETNLNDLQRRVAGLEGGGETRGIRQEIESLKASVADLRREMQGMRAEIVKELAGRIAKMQPSVAPASRAPAARPAPSEPTREYPVQSGDTLSFIAQAFKTTVRHLKELNGLKGDDLRVGQKLIVPDK